MSTNREPRDRRALVAIDLGAESCRVSTLRWLGDTPTIELLHRIANGPVLADNRMEWPLGRLLTGIAEGLRKAAASTPEGICSIAVDGWAVDYVRLQPGSESGTGTPICPPHCYRDERTVSSKIRAEAIVPPEEFFLLTGAQPMRINTVYQLFADMDAGLAPTVPWLLLPEYVLHWLGARPVAEYTNATHTGLVDLETGGWSNELFSRLGLSISSAPTIVRTGTIVGRLQGELTALPAFKDTLLIAPACHDTASAIASIAHDFEETAYIVSGTWSLVGTVIDRPISLPDAQLAGFTNQGAADGGYCFHTNVNGMWILKQCLDHWKSEGRDIEISKLIADAEAVESLAIINVDAPPLMLSGEMPSRINHELEAAGHQPIADIPGNEPMFARVVFASLASRYANVLRDLESLTGRHFKGIVTLGGGSRNSLLRRLTEESSGLPVYPGEVEGSTAGNFAIQLATLNRNVQSEPLSALDIRYWVERLTCATAAKV